MGVGTTMDYNRTTPSNPYVSYISFIILYIVV